MTIFRVQHTKNYSCINNKIPSNKNLSWRAKGILLYAMSRPDNWKFNVADLVNNSTDGEKSVKEGLKELKNAGYLVRCQNRTEKGRFEKSNWIFFEDPQEVPENFKIISPQAEKRPAEKRPAEKAPLLNTKKPNTEKVSNKQQQTKSKKEISTSAAAVFFESLEKEDIPIKEKIRLSKLYPKEVIDNAIQWLNHPKTIIIKTRLAALRWACNEKPEIEKSQEELIQENKNFAKSFSNRKSTKYIFDVLNKSIEFMYHSRTGAAICIEYTLKNFKSVLLKKLEEFEFKLIGAIPKNGVFV